MTKKKQTKPPEYPKLSTETVKAVERMWEAHSDLEGFMHHDEFITLRIALQDAREAVMGWPTTGNKSMDRATMEARWAFRTYCYIDPPPSSEDEVHWSQGKAKSDWAKRYVEWMTTCPSLGPESRAKGFTERQAFEAAKDKTQSRKPGRRPRKPARPEAERATLLKGWGRGRPVPDDDPGR